MISFSTDDLRTPESLERVLRQVVAEIQTKGTATLAQVPSMSQLLSQLLPQIQKQLQAGGSTPLNLQSLLPAGTGSVFTVGTFAARTAGLGPGDAGAVFYATDQSTAYVWTGSAWDTVTRRILVGTTYAIFTHANAADRTYTLPDATGNIPYETAVVANGNAVVGGGGALIKDSGTNLAALVALVVALGAPTSPYTPTSVTPTRTFDTATATTVILGNVLGTLIADLQAKGIVS